MATVIREVDKLEPVPDDQLRRQGKEYLVSALKCKLTCESLFDAKSAQEKHNINNLFNGLLQDLLKQQPRDPVQFMIDAITLGPDEAVQVMNSDAAS
jgi:hypothetical protein